MPNIKYNNNFTVSEWTKNYAIRIMYVNVYAKSNKILNKKINQRKTKNIFNMNEN